MAGHRPRGRHHRRGLRHRSQSPPSLLPPSGQRATSQHHQRLQTPQRTHRQCPPAGHFPPFSGQNTRSIDHSWAFASPQHAQQYLRQVYRRDRTEGQDLQIWLVVEKRTFSAQLEAWFSDYGFPRVALGGYSSESLEADLIDDLENDGRQAVILYAGDLDPSGEDIARNLASQLGTTDVTIVHIALTWEQVDHYALPPQPGKATDSRSRGFAGRHGRLIQVELEALDPSDLRDLYTAAISTYWNPEAYHATLKREAHDRQLL